VTIMNDKYIGSGQPRGYGYVEMTSNSEGKTTIANLEGEKMRKRVVRVVEALPLTNKNGVTAPDISNNYRSNKKRERKFQATRATGPIIQALDSYFTKEFNEFRIL
jgi:RNA recognition motif-containing protein